MNKILTFPKSKSVSPRYEQLGNRKCENTAIKLRTAQRAIFVYPMEQYSHGKAQFHALARAEKLEHNRDATFYHQQRSFIIQHSCKSSHDIQYTVSTNWCLNITWLWHCQGQKETCHV